MRYEVGDVVDGSGGAEADAGCGFELQDAYNISFSYRGFDRFGAVDDGIHIFRGSAPLGGSTPYDNTLPEDEKNIKSYLKYGKQSKSIDDAENGAVDIAYSIATDHCGKK